MEAKDTMKEKAIIVDKTTSLANIQPLVKTVTGVGNKSFQKYM